MRCSCRSTMRGMQKQILISGGGIGGLAAAIGAARAGCEVRLFERAAQFSEVGACGGQQFERCDCDPSDAENNGLELCCERRRRGEELSDQFIIQGVVG